MCILKSSYDAQKFLGAQLDSHWHALTELAYLAVASIVLIFVVQDSSDVCYTKVLVSFRQFVKLLFSATLIKLSCSCCLRLWSIWEKFQVSEDRFDSKMSLCLRGVATRLVFLGRALFVLRSALFGSVLMVSGERHRRKSNPEKALLTVDLDTSSFEV